MSQSCPTGMNESCPTHTNESCLTHMNESCHTHINESCHTHMTESCHNHPGCRAPHRHARCKVEEGLSLVTRPNLRLSHVTHPNLRLSHVTHPNLRLSHVTHPNLSSLGAYIPRPRWVRFWVLGRRWFKHPIFLGFFPQLHSGARIEFRHTYHGVMSHVSIS